MSQTLKSIWHYLGNALLVCPVLMSLSACTSPVRVSGSAGRSVLPQGASTSHASPADQSKDRQVNVDGFTRGEIDAESEADLGALKAWRLSLQGKERESMHELDLLEKKHPGFTTIDYMRGQCLEHLGKKKEAIVYYERAARGSEFTLYRFKLAEVLRTTGDGAKAISVYKKIIADDPDFIPARLGLAKALLSAGKDLSEAKSQVQYILQANPEDKEAKALANKMKVPG